MYNIIIKLIIYIDNKNFINAFKFIGLGIGMGSIYYFYNKNCLSYEFLDTKRYDFLASISIYI